jgi:hypothetical protein
MKRKLLALSMLTAMLVSLPLSSAEAARGFGRGSGGGRSINHVRGHRGHHHGHGHGNSFFGPAFGFGVGGFFDSDLAELYRELLKNVPYFALHPPVYYSYPVPRTYGYSPFAYPPGVMTPDLAAVEPLEIINPHVPSAPATNGEAAAKPLDTSAAVSRQPQPLLVINPFVGEAKTLAQHER